MSTRARVALALTVLLCVAGALAATGPRASAERGGVAVPGLFDPLEAIEVGSYTTCASGRFDGPEAKLWCWGDDNEGLLGNGPAPSGLTPGEIGPLPSVGAAHDVALGGAHACAIRVDGGVVCWGRGNGGRLGYGDEADLGDDELAGTSGTVDLGPGRTAKAIAAGGGHTCAILDTGDVRCWGEGSSGQLGGGNTATIGDDETPGSVPVVDLGVGRTATAIAAGVSHTCAILDDGRVTCWGYAESGRLGYGNLDDVGDDETPATAGTVDLGLGVTATAITAADDHTCAILTGGAVKCWGGGNSGLLGLGNFDQIGDDEAPGSAPAVQLGGPAESVSAGGSHTCAVVTPSLGQRAVRCWGSGLNGALGTGHYYDIPDLQFVGDDEHPDSLPPVDLGGRQARTVHAGGDTTCAPSVDPGTTERSIACWGDNGDAQLGVPWGGTASRIGDDEVPGLVRARFDRPELPDPKPPVITTETGPTTTATTPTTPTTTATTPTTPIPPAPPVAPPVRGESAVVAPARGTVRVQPRGRGAFRALRAGENLPMGSVVDATKGAARVTIARNAKGATQTMEFSGGRFRLTQPKKAGDTVATLDAPLACPKSRKASSAGSRATTRAKSGKKPRRWLWGSGTGAFATDGRYASASVRGTRWYVEDRCDGTIVRVVQGRVAVRDEVRGGTTVLRAGQRRFVPADRRRKPTRNAPPLR